MKAYIWPNAGELVPLVLVALLGGTLFFGTCATQYGSCSDMQASDSFDTQAPTDRIVDNLQPLNFSACQALRLQAVICMKSSGSCKTHGVMPDAWS